MARSFSAEVVTTISVAPMSCISEVTCVTFLATFASSPIADCRSISATFAVAPARKEGYCDMIVSGPFGLVVIFWGVVKLISLFVYFPAQSRNKSYTLFSHYREKRVLLQQIGSI